MSKTFFFITRSAGALALAVVTGACGSSTSSPLSPSTPLAATPANRGAVAVGAATTSSGQGFGSPSREGLVEIEFRGVVESIALPLLKVAGRTVETDANTIVLRGDTPILLTDLQVGNLVQVRGTSAADAVRAAAITLEDGPEAEESLRGTVESVALPALKVAGRTVETDANTIVLRQDARIALTDLRVGDLVEVEGISVAGGLLASRIKLEDGASDDNSRRSGDDGASDDRGGGSGDDGASDDRGGSSGDDGPGDDHGGGSSSDDGPGDDHGGSSGSGSGDDGGHHGGGDD